MRLYRTTKSLVDFEQEEAAIELMERKAEAIDGKEARSLIGDNDFKQLVDQSVWDTPLEFLEDWSISYLTSTIHNKFCVIVATTETDFIFTSVEDAIAMHRKWNAATSPQQWQRAQGFGPDGETPKRPHFNRRGG